MHPCQITQFIILFKLFVIKIKLFQILVEQHDYEQKSAFVRLLRFIDLIQTEVDQPI